MTDTSWGTRLPISAFWTFLGQSIPMGLALVLMPVTVAKLGETDFGILSLGWTLLTLSLVLNLGIGRSTTKFVAAIGRNSSDRISSLVWTSLLANAVLGLLALGVIIGLSTVLVRSLAAIPSESQNAAFRMFAWLGLAMPFVFATTTLRGVLEADNCFLSLNAVKIIFNSLIFLLPALGAGAGVGIEGIGILLALSRVGETISYWLLVYRRRPELWVLRKADVDQLRVLLTYGGWLTLSGLIQPVFANFDRLLIGIVDSLSSVTYYAVPTDAITKLGIIPGSFLIPLFPALSALYADGRDAEANQLHCRMLKYTLVGVGFGCAIIIIFSDKLLLWWVGGEFAVRSSLVARVMALGVLANSAASVPYTLLQAAGRPDLPAKFHLLEAPVSAALLIILVFHWGIVGAAVGWLLRAAADCALLLSASIRLRYVSLEALKSDGVICAAIYTALLLGASAAVALCQSTQVRFWLFGVISCVYAAAVSLHIIDSNERSFLLALIKKAKCIGLFAIK